MRCFRDFLPDENGKNFDMLKMIIGASSSPGGIVMDCFAGSGTTLGAAYELKRKWIGVDNSPESLKAILKRFTHGLEIYGDYVQQKEYVPQFLDIISKCSFSIFATEEDENVVDKICHN